MFLADFHMHSNASDGKLSMRELVDLYGERGFGAIAITDHLCDATLLGKASRYLNLSLSKERFPAYVAAIREEAARAWEEYEMVVLPGFELTKNTLSNHRSAHVLALGLESYVDPALDVADIARAIRAQGGLAIAAHPVSTRKFEKQTYHLWDRRGELRNAFDAWEVASGPHLFDEVLQSGLPLIASSDLHHRKQMTSWKTVLECERHPEAIMDAIRRQELRFHFYRDAQASEMPAARPWRHPAEPLRAPFPVA
jgi:predicted metal-dependent phosphoesterase TrpH